MSARAALRDGLVLGLVLAAVAALLWRAVGLDGAAAAAALGGARASYVVRTVTAGAVVLGLVSGILGTLAVTRGQSLLGDVASHSALPGLYALFILWTWLGLGGAQVGPFVLPAARSLPIVLTGALLSALAAAALVVVVRTHTPLREDAALGVALSTFFGAGIVLRSLLQNHGDASARAGLEAFLFGSVATMTRGDVAVLATLAALVLLVVGLLWKELALLCFDPDYLATLGFPERALDALLSALIVVTVIIGLQLVGVILMSALLIAPAVAARQWSDRLGRVALLAVLVAVAGGLVGVLASSAGERIPTGPVIAIYVAGVAFASILVAPRRGVLWAAQAAAARRRAFALDTLLVHLHAHGEAPVGTLARQLGWSRRRVATTVGLGLADGLLARAADGPTGAWRVAATPAGRAHAAGRLSALVDDTGRAAERTAGRAAEAAP